MEWFNLLVIVVFKLSWFMIQLSTLERKKKVNSIVDSRAIVKRISKLELNDRQWRNTKKVEQKAKAP